MVMDADRFDRLARSLTTGRSRRGALATLLGGALGLLGLAETAARKGRKKKGKKKKGTCKPNCIAPMTCQRGKCDCPDPTVLCNGECYVNTCNAGLAFNPLTCECCRANGSGGCFSGPPSCCSNVCVEVTNVCSGRNMGAPCDFGAQCASGFCSPAGVCVLPTP
jgi:hypothetical protein